MLLAAGTCSKSPLYRFLPECLANGLTNLTQITANGARRSTGTSGGAVPDRCAGTGTRSGRCCATNSRLTGSTACTGTSTCGTRSSANESPAAAAHSLLSLLFSNHHRQCHHHLSPVTALYRDHRDLATPATPTPQSSQRRRMPRESYEEPVRPPDQRRNNLLTFRRPMSLSR
jgi:hypothetical protein